MDDPSELKTNRKFIDVLRARPKDRDAKLINQIPEMCRLFEGAAVVQDYLTNTETSDKEIPHHPPAVGMISPCNVLQDWSAHVVV